MNQEKQPEALPDALKIANTCREARIDLDCQLFQSTALADAEYAICKMHTRIAELEADRVLEAARTAEEKLRADQMTEQHRMQTNMRMESDRLIIETREKEDRLRVALEVIALGSSANPVIDAGDELVAQGYWREDALKEDRLQNPVKADPRDFRIADLEAQLSAIGAGGVEQLRKNTPARGQYGFEAWWRDKYPSLAMHAPDVWEAAMHHSAQSSPECLQQSAEPVVGQAEAWVRWLKDGQRSHNPNSKELLAQCIEGLIAGLQAAPPAPAGVAVPDEAFKGAWLAHIAGMHQKHDTSNNSNFFAAGFRAALAAAPAQAQDDRAAFKAYLQECDDCEIVPDVAGAFHAAWQKRATPAQAVAVAELDMDRVLSIADVHAEESREDGTRLLDRGGLVAFAKDVLRVAAPAQDAASSITVDFKQATELLAIFGGEPAEVTLIEGPGHSGEGVYAYYSDLPEEGAGFLGTSDNEALPAAPAQEHATQLAGHGREVTPDGVPSNVELRGLWYGAGGSFHGPSVETGTMPETKLLPFLRSLMAAPAQAQEDAAALEAPAAPEWERVRRGLSMMMMGFASTPGKPLQAAEAALDAATEPGMPLACLRALAAAEALSEEGHGALSRDDLTDTEVFAVADPLFAHQQIGGRVPSQDLDGFRELIGSALSDAVFQRAAPAQAQEDARDALTLEELDQLDRAIEHFVEGEDTDVDWRLLTRAASLGYLECERFTVPPTARAAIDAARAAQSADPDLDAWECEKCHGTGIHEFAGYGDSPRGQYPITQREDCDQCETVGWCGPDAEAAARAAQGGAA